MGKNVNLFPSFLEGHRATSFVLLLNITDLIKGGLSQPFKFFFLLILEFVYIILIMFVFVCIFLGVWLFIQNRSL